jgi:transposase
MQYEREKLPDDPEALKGIIVDLCARYNKDTELFLEQIRELRDKLFGRKSEKIPTGSEAVQLPLFDMPEPEKVEGEEAEVVEIPAHTRKKCGRKALPEDLPRVEVVHDIPENEKICGCGNELTRIGEEVSEQLDIVPARIQVIKNIRPKYACRACEGVEDSGPTVKIAPVPAQIIPKSIVTSGLLAHVLTGKFVDAMPFYRQEKQFSRLGVEISRTTMCNWAMKAAAACTPLYELLQKEVLAGYLIHIDETTVQVLDEPGRAPTQKSYMWIFQRGDPERPVLIYQYNPSRSGDVVAKFLPGYAGAIMTDGYAGYDFLDRNPDIKHLGCWAHARRKFVDVIKAQGKNRNKTGSADVAVNSYIGKLYKLENEAKEKKLKPDEIYRMRQEKAKPIVANFKAWLDKRMFETPPKGLLGQAMAYTLNQWHRLIGYLEDGRLPIDNNAVENSIRPFVVGRKNWLFSGTPEGAAASAMLYSLIETAKANKLEPYSYLRFIFERLPLASTAEDLQALLPWNLTMDQLGIVPLIKVD